MLFALHTRHPAGGARNPRADAAPVEGCVTIQVKVGVVVELLAGRFGPAALSGIR